MTPDTHSSASARIGHTRELARHAAHSRFSDLPDAVSIETTRAFTNWFGCVLGGCREPAVEIAAATVGEAGGRPQASVIGHAFLTDVANAYKPYPCGIVINPTLDACLDLRSQSGPDAKPVDVTLRVHPLAISMTGVCDPNAARVPCEPVPLGRGGIVAPFGRPRRVAAGMHRRPRRGGSAFVYRGHRRP